MLRASLVSCPVFMQKEEFQQFTAITLIPPKISFPTHVKIRKKVTFKIDEKDRPSDNLSYSAVIALRLSLVKKTRK